MSNTTRIVMAFGSFVFLAAAIVVGASLSGLYMFCFLPLMVISWLLATKVAKDTNDKSDDNQEFIRLLNHFNDKYSFTDDVFITFVSNTNNVKRLEELLEKWEDINELDPLEEEHNSNVLHITLQDYREGRSNYDIVFKEFIQKRISQLK